MAFSLDEYKKKKEADASASKSKQTTSGGFSLTEYAKQKAAAQEPAVAASTVSVKTPVTKQQAQADKANALAEDLMRQQAADYLATQNPVGNAANNLQKAVTADYEAKQRLSTAADLLAQQQRQKAISDAASLVRYNQNLPTATTPAQAAQSKADSLYAQNLLEQEIGRATVRAQQEAAQPVYDLDYQAAQRLDVNRQLVNAQAEIDRLEEQKRTMDFTGRNDGSMDAPLMAAYQRLAELQGQSSGILSNDEIEQRRQAQANRERTQRLMTMNVPLARETTDRLEALQEELRTLQFTGGNTAAVNDILRQIAELQGSGYVTDRSDISEAEKLQRLTELENVRYNQDYGAKRLYDQQYGIQSSEWSSARQTYDVQGDLIYDYVNAKNDARTMELADSLSNGALAAGVDLSRLKEMTKDEKYVYNYLYATQGKDVANEYLQLLSSELNAKQMQGLRKEVAAFAKEHPIVASVASVPMGWAKGLSYLGQIVDYAKDGEIDQNAGYNRYTLIPSTIREEVSSRWGEKGSFAYQTAMSMLDFLSQAALSGSFGADGKAAETISKIASLGIMGTGAAADGTLAALNRGLSSQQAMSLGTIAGVAEAATELVSVETLLDMTNMDKSIVGYLLKNTIAEGSEEVASDFINLFADVLTAKDKSEWSQSVQAYVADGYDEKEAFWKAFSDQAAQMGLDFLGGALSGFTMAGITVGASIGSDIVDAASDAREMRQLERVLTGFVEAQNEELTRQVEEAKQNPAEAAQTAFASEQAAISQENAQTAPVLTQNGEMAAEATQAAPERAQAQTQEQQAQTERRQLLQSYADTMTGNLGSTMTEMYDGQQDVGAYAGAMTEAYNVGRDGGALADIDVEVAQLISPEQRIAAYNAGRMDAMTTTNQNGGTTNGTAEVSLRESGERNDRSNPGESVRGLEEGAGRASGWRRSTRRAADGGAARLSYSEGVSLASLGVSGGSRNATLHTVTGGTTESLTSAETLCKQRGLRLVAVAGDDLIVTQRLPDGTKQTITARALIIGDRVFARVDDPDFTIDQIVRHEAGHDMIRKGEIDVKEIRQKLEKVMDIDLAAQMYAEAYAMSGEQMSPDEIWEEMICDSLGDMNAFDGRQQENVGQYVMTQVKVAAEENRSERAARGPPAEDEKNTATDDGAKFSRKTTEDNRPFVEVDEDILNGVPEKDWASTVKENLKQKFPYGVTVGNSEIHIDKQSRQELTFSKYMRWLLNNDPQLRSDKLRATNNADEILQATTDWINEGLNHPRRDKIADFARGNVLLRVGGNDYTADVVVGMRKNGSMLLYDILNMQPTSFTEKETVAAIAENPSPGTNRSTATVSDDSVAQDAGAVKASRVLREIDQLRRENDQLRERVEYFKGQTQATKQASVRLDDVKKFSGSIVKSYDSTVKAADIQQSMKELGDLIVRGGDYMEIRDRAMSIARDVVQNASVLVDDANAEMYRELRDVLRSRQILVSKADAENIADYKDWRRRYNGRLRLKNSDASNIDVVYADLAEQFPGLFPEDIQNPGDQLEHLGYLADAYRDVYQNPYSYNMAVVIEDCANDIIDGLTNGSVRLVGPTYADRARQAQADALLAGQMAQGRKDAARLRRTEEQYRQRLDRARQALMDVRTDRDMKIADLKENVRTRNAQRSERNRAAAIRNKIQKHARALTQELLHPTDKKHIPDVPEIKGPVLALLNALDFSSTYDYKLDSSGNYVRVPRGSDLYAEPTKRTMAFTQIKAMLSEMAGEMAVDPILTGSGNESGYLDDIIKLGNKPIGDMTAEELDMVWNAVKSIEGALRSYNRAFALAKAETISDAANGLRADNSGKAPGAEYKGFLGKFQRLTGLDMMTPQAYFHRLGESGDNIFKSLRKAQDKQIKLMQEASDFTTELTKDIDVRKLESEIHTVELGGQNVKLSTAQLMELYILNKRAQAVEHIYEGGILPDSVEQRRSIKKVSRVEAIRGIMPQDVASAIGLLTAEQIRIADELQRYASTRLSEMGNEASMDVYGYKKFGEENYWPIRTNKQDVKSDVEKDTQVTNISNKGFTKAVKPHANTSLRVGSIFDTFATHASEMANYSAWLGVMEDVNRIRNFTYRDGDGNRIDTAKAVIDRVHGSGGSAYLQKLLSDLSNGVKGTHAETDYMGSFTGNYKASAIGGNTRVIIQQPTAILRALSMIDAKYLAQAGNVASGWKKALKYAPIAVWKDWGYFDINTGRQMKDVLFNSDSALDKTKNALMAGAGFADSVSWGALWNACEAEAKAKNKSLKPNTEEFYEAVADRFGDIIDKTQVVDGILQRSQIMRSADGLTKMATSFMGEPMKQYNMLLSTVYDVRHANGASKTEAKRSLARATTALLVSGVANAAAQAIIDAVRSSDRDKKYWEKWEEAFFGLTGNEKTISDGIKAVLLDGNLGSQFDPLNYIPYVKDVLSIAQGFDVERMDMSGVSDTIQAAQNLLKAVNGGGKNTIAGALANAFAQASRLLGIPVANLKREAESFLGLYAQETGSVMMQYELMRWTLRPDFSSNKAKYYDLLYQAYKSGDDEFRTLYRKLEENGYEAKDIKSAMESRMKKDEQVSSVKDLSKRFVP